MKIRRISVDAAADAVTLKLAGFPKGNVRVTVLGGILSDGGASSNAILEALIQ